MQTNLSEKLTKFTENLSEAEQANYKLLLGLAAGGLTPDFDVPLDEDRRKAFGTVGDCLVQLQPYSKRISEGGIAWRGRPEFMTDTLLKSLQEEARQIRPNAINNDNHFLGPGAPIANVLATSRELTELVSLKAGTVQPTGIASFLYYDKPGHGIPPHVDTDVFSLNVILMLNHEIGDGAPSCLVVFPPHRPAEKHDLAPGEMIIMFAGSIAHAREYVKPGETVTILTFGFHPLGE